MINRVRFRSVSSKQQNLRVRVKGVKTWIPRRTGVLTPFTLSASQQNISKHLAVLAEVGILGRRKEGNHVYYRVVDEGVFALCEAVCGSVQQQLRSLNELVTGVTP
jgi:DNA-binding transcriptional ArsR family regulator